jgi:hypothetical protein
MLQNGSKIESCFAGGVGECACPCWGVEGFEMVEGEL